MRVALWNLLLALIWLAMTGVFSSENFIFGIVLGFLALLISRRVQSPTRLIKTVELIGYFLYELVLANVRLAWDIATPSTRMRPGIIAIPLDVKTEMQILLLTSLISLTPGTLSLDISPDRSTLYVHVLYLSDPDTERQHIKQGFERRVLEVMPL
jgi:multicomponent Na+:H+ antiporter subunit E